MAPLSKPTGDRHRRYLSKESDEDAAAVPSPNLHVGNLTPDTTDKDLSALFGKYGPLESVATYSPRNYAFVCFRSLEDAKMAKGTLQGALVRGNSIKIEFAKPAKPCKRLWVGGISSTLSREQVEEEFSKFGKIEEFKLFRDRNSALVDYYKIEDAVDALKSMNGKNLGGEQIRVDFVRSQPARRDWPDHDSWLPPEAMRNFPESSQRGHKRPLMHGGRREGPTKVLFVKYPESFIIDEHMLHNAMILFGEIERIKSLPGRNYAFVEFRSVDEARRAKEGLQGRLFNDPRIQIMFANSDAPLRDSPPLPFTFGRGPHPDMFVNELPYGLTDQFIPGHSMGPNNFPGPLHPNMGMRPFAPQGFDPVHGILEFNDVNHRFPDGNRLPWSRLSPSAPGILHSAPGIRPPLRPLHGPWDGFDARDSKMPRIDGPLLDDVPFHMRTLDGQGVGIYGSPQMDRRAAGHTLDSPIRMKGPIASLPMEYERRGPSHSDHCWRGLIAKGGTPVCRARCIPIGKGIDSPIPEVVNCSARTGLDMLAKHYAEANGFNIVFFLPDSEEDFASYTEFLRYLGVKNRAGVAKFDDGTTLFLVPPSDFLSKVLNVSGPERLYGVVLKLQPSIGAAGQEPQPVPPSTSKYIDRQHIPQNSYGLVSQNDDQPINPEYNNAVGEDLLSHQGGGRPPLAHVEESHTVTQVAPEYVSNPANATQAEFSLTPELLATLASLAPARLASGQSSATVQLPSNISLVSQSYMTSVVPDKGIQSQGWSQDHQGLVSGAVHQRQVTQSSQQLGQHLSNQASVSQYPDYSNISNLPDQSAQALPLNPEMQEASVNAQHLVDMPARQMGNYAYPSQGVQNSANPGNQLDDVYSSQRTYGLAQTENMGGIYNSQLVQQSIPSTSLSYDQGGQLVQPQRSMEVIDNVNRKLPSQLQQLQSSLSSSVQGTASEADKNQRYQSTLQLAANLLMQIQQQQQQTNTLSLQGSGNQQ